MSDWDYEHEGKPVERAAWQWPLWMLWYDTQILVVAFLVVLRWALLLGAQSVEAELGFKYTTPAGKDVDRQYRINLPGWLC